MEYPIENWQRVWREGIAPSLSLAGLEALQRALQNDDPKLVQGATSVPPPLQAVQDWPVEAACAISYAGWQGELCLSVADVESYFARVCFETDKRLGEPAACRHFLNFWDETPRDVVFAQMLPEVKRAIALKQEEAF
jgi:hypothetical protein